MTKIDRYVLHFLLTLFGFFALVLVSVYWVNRAVRLFDQLLSDGQTALVVLEFTALTLPLVISVVLPVAAFAAAAYGTNRLSGDSELVAMHAAGLSPWRLARPVAVFGVFVAVMVAILVHALVPMARTRLANREAEIAENLTAQFLQAGEFQFPTDDITLFIRDIAADGRLLDIMIQDDRDAERQLTYTAEEALLVRDQGVPVLIMLNGMIQMMTRMPDGGERLAITRFSEISQGLDGLVSQDDRASRDLRAYGTRQLLSPTPDMLERTGATANEARIAAHDRIAQPLLSPVAALIGFSALMLGGFSRFGLGRQIALGILALILVQFLGNAAADQAQSDASRWPLLYLPALVGIGIVCLFLWLASRSRRVKGDAL